MDHSLVVGCVAPGRRNHRGVSRNLSGEKIRAVRGPSRKISKFPKIPKKLAMVNLPDFAEHREKRNFAQLFINSAERTSAKNGINAIPRVTVAHAAEGVPMKLTVTVAPVIAMFIRLKWMRMGA